MDYLDAHGWTQRELSRRTGLTPKTISEICSGKASISPNTSLAFERVLGRPAHFWMNLQSRFDEAVVRRVEKERAAGWESWVREFPVAEMRKRGWLAQPEEGESDAMSLLRFLGVSSPDSWNTVWQASRVAYRQTRKFKTSEHAISAWIREVEIEAENIETRPFSEDALRKAIPELRKNTRLQIEDALTRAQEICAQCGISLVAVPALPRTGISGCTKWLSDSKVAVALSLRYKVDDQIWFTFFHEIGHVLLHRKKHAFIVDNADEFLSDGVVDPDMRQVEDEANGFSADTMIPPLEMKDFLAQGVFDNESIYDFSDAIDIAPGIVVGRLQREGVLLPHQGNSLKQRVEFGFEDGEGSQ